MPSQWFPNPDFFLGYLEIHRNPDFFLGPITPTQGKPGLFVSQLKMEPVFFFTHGVFFFILKAVGCFFLFVSGRLLCFGVFILFLWCLPLLS